jgi:hypothetical protein
MAYVIVVLLGVIAGGIIVYVLLDTRRKALEEQKLQQDDRAQKLREMDQALDGKQRELEQQIARLATERAEFESKAVTYSELQGESTILKRDLQNIDVYLRKLQLDTELQRQNQESLDKRAQELGGRYMKDNVKWVSASLTPSNFVVSKQRLQNVIEWCREIGLEIPAEEEAALLANLKQEFEKVVRAAFEREEQARIRAQIREEQKLEREIQREREQAERERAAIQAALDRALAEARDEHSAEVEQLRARLAEAEEKARAVSQAQLTKCGHIYIISNVGSFGDGVFKIGMTRRLEPMDRIRELGDASVPFPFDVHMMISCNDAPALENALHRTLHKLRINKINLRKEFFRTDIESIRSIVEEHHGEVEYVADAEALEYRQSLEMTDEDLAFIESVYDEAEEEHETSTIE